MKLGYEHYQIRIYYSDEDKVWFAEATRESILQHGQTPQEALERIIKLIPEYEQAVFERLVAPSYRDGKVQVKNG